MGLTLSSTLGLYQLDQQVACQRYRQTILDANSKIRGLSDSLVASLKTINFGQTATPALV
jgi:hypothetical protein